MKTLYGRRTVTRRPADLAVTAVITVFGGFALAAVAARTLAFTTLAVPVAWRQALSAPLQTANELMIFCFVTLGVEIAVPFLFAVLFLVRRSFCVRRTAAGRLELLPFWHLVAWPLVALNQFFLDFVWPVGLACWVGVALTDFTTRTGPSDGVPGGRVEVGVLDGGVGVAGELGELLMVTSWVNDGPASFPSI